METINQDKVRTCPKVSIITPVYNVEKYLSRCIDSIIAQSFQDWELLLIDDGSSDNSGKICDEYAKKDLRIEVFHKQNGGVSSARNIGLDNSIGEWLMFVDADDWLNKDALQSCLNNVGDADFARFGMNVVYSQSYSVIDTSVDESWCYDEYFGKVVGRKTTLSVWGGLYRRSLFETWNIRFNSKYALGEDWLTLYSLLKAATNIKLINRPLYNYNMMNAESAVRTLNINKSLQLIEVASVICKDAYCFKGNAIAKEVSDCKCDVSINCIAGLLVKKTKFRILKTVLISLKKHKLYPLKSEIVHSNQPFKFKVLLLVFNFIIKLF